MLFFFNKNDKIAGGAASFAGVTSATDAELHSFLNAGRDVDGDGFFPVDAAFSFTNCTFCCHDGAFAVACRAGGDRLHLAEEGIADTAYLAAAATGTAGLYAILVFGAAAATGSTGYVFLYLDIFGNAFGYFFIVELDLYAEVGASDASGTAITAAATPAATEEAAEDVISEDISELAEDVTPVHVAAVEAPPAVAGETCMSVAVILGPFVCVAEHFIGFCGLLELIFRCLIPGIAIGMELHGYFPVGLFDLFRGGRLRYSQYFVIISF